MNTIGENLWGNQNVLGRDLKGLVRGSHLWNVLGFCLFVVAFYFAYSHGMSSFSQVSASPFWIPDSILLCALLMSPPRRWWIFVLAPLPIRLFVGATQNFPLGFFLSNVKRQLQNGGDGTVGAGADSPDERVRLIGGAWQSAPNRSMAQKCGYRFRWEETDEAPHEVVFPLKDCITLLIDRVIMAV